MTTRTAAAGLALVTGLAVAAMAHDEAPGGKLVHSEPGTNAWNAGRMAMSVSQLR